MPMAMILGCEACGTRWRFLQMKKTDGLPGCPNPSCTGTVAQELAAPRIGRGAVEETAWKVPDTQAKREAMAYKVAEELGATNINTNQRSGDIAAPKVPDPEIVAPNGRTAKVPIGFQQVGGRPEDIASSIASLTGGAGAGANRESLGILGAMGRR